MIPFIIGIPAVPTAAPANFIRFGFDEASGAALDSGPHALTATVSGARSADTMFGTGYSLDCSTGGCAIVDFTAWFSDNNYPLAYASLSLVCRYKTGTINHGSLLNLRSSANVGGYSLEGGEGAHLNFCFPGLTTVTWNDLPADNQWHSLVLTYDKGSNDVKLYCDGALVFTGNMGGSTDGIPAGYHQMKIGRNCVDGQTWPGLIDDAGWYIDSVLTATEALHYHQGTF